MITKSNLKEMLNALSFVIEDLKKTRRILKFYTNNDFAFF